MARNKNSTALFDVIHSAKRPPKASPSASIPTPKWWGKGKPIPKPPVVESRENVGKQGSWLSAAKRNGTAAALPAQAAVVQPASIEIPTQIEAPSSVETENVFAEHAEVEPVAVEAPVAEPVVAEPKVRFIDRFKNRTIERAPVEPEPVADETQARASSLVEVDPEPFIDTPAPEAKPDRPSRPVYAERDPAVSLDSAAGDIRFRLSYAGLVAIGFIFVLLLAIAFIAGKQMSTQTADDSSLSAADGKEPTTAPTSGMMIALDQPNTAVSQDGMPVRPDVLSLPAHPSKPTPVQATDVAVKPSLPMKTTRDIGMVYVVVQSYAEQELAQKACDFMNHAGIPCSLVQGPAHWAPGDWYSVVGLQPFTKHDPALADYEKSVKALGVKFTAHAIDQFQPSAYTWREDSDMSQP